MPRRLLVPIAVLACAALLVAGCGGEGEPDATGVESPAKAEALRKVAASDYARAINIRQSDVPYFETIPDEEPDDPEAEARRERETERCMGLEGESPTPLAEVASPTYGVETSRSAINVESSVTVEDDPADIEGEFERLRSPRALHCMREYFLEVMSEEETAEIDGSGATVTRIAFPGELADGTVAFRFKATVTVSEGTAQTVAFRPAAESVSVDVYIDIFSFVSGDAVVSLSALGIPSPVGKGLERNLLRVLRERAAAQTPEKSSSSK